MAWTQAQLENLEKAIAEGVLTVRYEDRSTTYRSLAEMSRVLEAVRRQLDPTLGATTRARVAVDKDLG